MAVVTLFSRHNSNVISFGEMVKMCMNVPPFLGWQCIHQFEYDIRQSFTPNQLISITEHNPENKITKNYGLNESFAILHMREATDTVNLVVFLKRINAESFLTVKD